MSGHLRLARYALDDAVRDLLGKEIADRVATAALDSDADEAILSTIGAHALRRYLPGEILQSLKIFSVSGRQALLLRNLPVQDFPPTPVTGFGDEPALALINALHFGLIQLLGATPFAVDYENDGHLIRNVVPNPHAGSTTSSWGADTEFFWHSDNPHLPFGAPGSDPRPYVPQYLTFYVVRNEEEVPTEITGLENVIQQLDHNTLHTLHQPEFTIGAPASNGADTQPASHTAILSTSPDGHHRVRYDLGTTHGQTPRAQAALHQWTHALRNVPSQDFTLQPGDFLTFDNYRILHRRRAFTPQPPDHARWLRRCYVS